ncbi:hypothetical protein DUI87_17713 [Hirundo rustica rustica]|uniref:Reverse transcriptase/retrotransposon-derived protein RNase H-like domain-containing protein n=1 Tax=Hirundo rustica rustica TaxID=333673 RepID=A0A3M0JXY7_HIRRU|nr:hypothetical protein DUI87_17713 [Hirundo rustica rustica]
MYVKGVKIIQFLLKASFAIKKSKIKGPAQEIQFLGVKWQDELHQIPTNVINKITAMSPLTNNKEIQAFLSAIGFCTMHIPEYSQMVSFLYLVTHNKNSFLWSPGQQQAFAQIKQEIAHVVALGPVRTGPDVKNVLYSAARSNESGKQPYEAQHDRLQKLLKEEVDQANLLNSKLFKLALDIAERGKWPKL